jgi:hypothetical protein
LERSGGKLSQHLIGGTVKIIKTVCREWLVRIQMSFLEKNLYYVNILYTSLWFYWFLKLIFWMGMFILLYYWVWVKALRFCLILQPSSSSELAPHPLGVLVIICTVQSPLHLRQTYLMSTVLTNNAVTYAVFASLIRWVLDLIEFIGSLYSWLQQATHHYLTHYHLPTGHFMGTILTSIWTVSYCWLLIM